MPNILKPDPAPGFQRDPQYKMLISQAHHTANAERGGVRIASTKNAILLSEHTYKNVLYFPRIDVDLSALRATETSSFCPFKGTASYWTTAKTQENSHRAVDICWSYEQPFDEAAAIGGYIAFYPNEVTIRNR